MKLSSSLAIYQFSLPSPLLLPLSLTHCLSLSQCPVGLPVWLADTLDSTHMSGHAWLCSAIFRSFLLYFILFSLSFFFLFQGSPIRIVSNKFWLKLPNVGSSISISSRSLALNVIYELGSKKSLIARREKQQRRQRTQRQRIMRKVKAVLRRLNN